VFSIVLLVLSSPFDKCPAAGSQKQAHKSHACVDKTAAAGAGGFGQGLGLGLDKSPIPNQEDQVVKVCRPGRTQTYASDKPKSVNYPAPHAHRKRYINTLSE